MSTTIRRLLVANRGEIARRVFRTCRRLGIETVAVYSEADADSPHVIEADSAVLLGPAAASESYLKVEAILAAAATAEADAIHPGYGFLAENAEFATAVIEAGRVWVGPQPDVMLAMGSKVSARRLMEAAGVPVVPGAELDDEDPDTWRAQAKAVGYPLMVKASAGGGGKGMRIVKDASALIDSVAAAKRESAAAFGDDTVFLERYVGRSRHVEVQILGDRHDTVIALPERDCSVQRRYQKVIEESPSPAVGADLREALATAAVKGASALSYEGAGTFEFLLDSETDDFYFLEMNTRLQVEHPVTELVTGLDLVELQILVAEGKPLPEGLDGMEPRGHAVETRLYAEDPAAGFLPSTGVVWGMDLPGEVRVDAGVEVGFEVGPHYDPMLAKVISHGPDREQAIRQLASALRRADLRGLITNRDFLVRVLEDAVFRDGDFDTQFLENRADQGLTEPLVEATALAGYAIAAALSGQAERREQAGILAGLPSGWRNSPSAPQRIGFTSGDTRIDVAYRFGRGGQLAELEVDGEAIGLPVIHSCRSDRVDLTLSGLRRRYRIADGPKNSVYVSSARGQAELIELPRHGQGEDEAFAGSLTSPMPGQVIRTMVVAGDRVQGGQPLMILEAMKMEHEIVAPADGIVTELLVAVGDQIETAARLAVVSEEETE